MDQLSAGLEGLQQFFDCLPKNDQYLPERRASPRMRRGINNTMRRCCQIVLEHIHKQARELARREGVSLNQLISMAVAGKPSAPMTKEYLEQRARRGSRARFEAVLSKVPDREPLPSDL